MATIGQPLVTQEAGWNRYEQTNTCITQAPAWGTTSVSGSSGGTVIYTSTAGYKLNFNFHGTGIRIVSELGSAYEPNVQIIIDGTQHTYSQVGTAAHQVLLYELVGLVNKEHTVQVVVPGGKQVYFDVVDILNGCISPYNASPSPLVIKNSVHDMGIGDMIPCRYTVTTTGTIGKFSELGACTATTEIPLTGGATPDGVFYFIKADTGLLIADRVLHTSISWDTLNSGKLIQGKGDSVPDTINVGGSPRDIWGDDKTMYVTNQTLNVVHCVDRATNSIVNIPTGNAPYGIWGDSTEIYVINHNSANVTCIKRSDNSVTTISTGTTPNDLWGDSTNVYVANYGSNNVTCIKRSDHTTTTIVAGTSPSAIWGDSTQVYVANGGSSNVTCIKRSDSTTTTISVGSVPYALWGDATHVYVCNDGSSSVTRILRSTNATVQITVSSNPEAIWGDANYVYVSNYGANVTSRITRSDNTVLNITTVGNCRTIVGDANYIYVANYGSKSLMKINRSTNTIVTTISTGTNPRGMWMDSSALYVANYGSGSIYKYELPIRESIYRAITGGSAYRDSNNASSTTNSGLGSWPLTNEWDKYIAESDLGGKITPGDTSVWNWYSSPSNWTQDTPAVAIASTGTKVIRGTSGAGNLRFMNTPGTTAQTSVGFRAVLEYPEDPKCKNSWY